MAESLQLLTLEKKKEKKKRGMKAQALLETRDPPTSSTDPWHARRATVDRLVASEPVDVTRGDSSRRTLQQITPHIANPEFPEQTQWWFSAEAFRGLRRGDERPSRHRTVALCESHTGKWRVLTARVMVDRDRSLEGRAFNSRMTVSRPTLPTELKLKFRLFPQSDARFPVFELWPQPYLRGGVDPLTLSEDFSGRLS